MNSVGATGGRLDMTYSRFYCLFLFDGVLVVRGIGRLFGLTGQEFCWGDHRSPAFRHRIFILLFASF